MSYSDIGGLDTQKQEVREAVELPLTHFELYKQIGIDPPRGVLMYGPPGCGKTMLAKAVAHHTTASFIRVVGSEFVQKYLGEGPRMVRDVFRLAKENSPAIIFIDEIDAIATKRFDAQTGADREVQRILLELLNQMDGFDQTVNVKVIMATNRHDTLDPALLRPGRLDRKIEFPLPDRRQKVNIFCENYSRAFCEKNIFRKEYFGYWYTVGSYTDGPENIFLHKWTGQKILDGFFIGRFLVQHKNSITHQDIEDIQIIFCMW